MRVLIVPNNDNDRAAEAARDLVSWLTASGHEAALLPQDAGKSVV